MYFLIKIGSTGKYSKVLGKQLICQKFVFVYKYMYIGIFLRQITTFIKVHLAYVFGLQTL